MRIYVVSPGVFNEGFNSALRGEGRWLLGISEVFASTGHEVVVFGESPLAEYFDRGVKFSSLSNFFPAECDLLISMTPYSDAPLLDKTKYSVILDQKFKPGKRILALFFPTSDAVYDSYPVIHPWDYQGRGTFIPLITHKNLSPPSFIRNRFHWHSKKPNDMPQYLIPVLRGIRRLCLQHSAQGLFVDGAWILYGEYPPDFAKSKALEAQFIFKEIMRRPGNESLDRWAPYDYSLSSIQSSKLLIGTHSPISSPSMAEISVSGGFPILFENQKNVPPYDTVDIPFIPLKSSEKEIEDFIVRLWTDEDLFCKSVLTCQKALQRNSYFEASKAIGKFLEEI